MHDFIPAGGCETDGMTPQVFRKVIETDTENFGEVIRVGYEERVKRAF